MQKMIQVNVTKLDIQRGIRRNSALCPVARAIRRAIKIKRASNKDNRVRVSRCGVSVKSDGKWCELTDRTSKKRKYNVRKFVSDFDNRFPVEPCKLFLVRD